MNINSPRGITLAPNGYLYVSTGTTHQIIKVSTTGSTTVLAGNGSGYQDGTGTNAKFANPTGLVVDAKGNVYVADTSNHRIRKISSTGVATTMAGGVAGFQDGAKLSAKFQSPFGIAKEASGSLLVTDKDNDKNATPHSNSPPDSCAGPLWVPILFDDLTHARAKRLPRCNH